MKVVAFNGSARSHGNTAILIRAALAALEKEGIKTEMVELAGAPLRGCTACYHCYKAKDRRCVVGTDAFNQHLQKMIEADAIILGSPVYVADVSSEMKALIDRACLVTRANGNLLRRKIGAGIVCARRGGAIHAFDSLNHFFLISEMVVVGSNYWNVGHGRQPGEVEQDAEGMETMRLLGENMAWLLKKVRRDT